jgi:hypothetical protein
MLDGFVRITLISATGPQSIKNTAVAFWATGAKYASADCYDIDEIRRVEHFDLDGPAGRSISSLEIKVRPVTAPTGVQLLRVEGVFLIGVVPGPDMSIKRLVYSYIFLPGIKWEVQADLNLFGHFYKPGIYVMSPGAELHPISQ